MPPTLAITPHVRNDLAKFDPFTYSTATTLGLSEDASAIADKAIANIVTKAVAAGESANTSQCTEGSPPCGQFIQTIAVEPCVDGYLCVLENVGMTLIGSMITEAYAATLALSTTTGEPAQLSDFVPDADLDSFVKDVNDQVATVLISEGVYDEQMPPDLKPRDITAWLPHPDGILVWFPKYLAGPGALGVVTVLVPYPGTAESTDETVPPSAEVAVEPEPEPQESAPKATQQTYDPSGEQVEWAGDYLCYATPTELPRLRDASADKSATEMLQVIVILLGYNPGPIDGAYGPVTKKAVTAFQRDHALIVDGLVGPQTWGALKGAYC